MDRRNFVNKSVIALAAIGSIPLLSRCSPAGSPLSGSGDESESKKKGEGSSRLSSITQPTIMNWTILPITYMAKCWIDSTFKSGFLSNPTAAFANRPSLINIPSGATFAVYDNASASDRNFALPFFHSGLSGLSRTQVASILQTETGGDTSLQWFLPADVIEEAFYNSTFKSSLLSNPASAISSMGYSTSGLSISVYANTSTLHNLALPTRPSGINSSSSYATALGAASSLMDLASSKCCGTGTCDEESEDDGPQLA